MDRQQRSVVAVIPARWGSTRFPGKPLALLAGKAMIVHVIERARSAATVDQVVVATDDERIAAAAAGVGCEVVMTGDCASGTDRMWHALAGRDDWELAVNLQGDEPLLSGRNVDLLVAAMRATASADIGTLCRPLPPERATDANAVKVVRGRRNQALYFSRAAIPYPRDPVAASSLWRLHLGIYAYRAAALRRFVGLPVAELERAEGLEQLRALADGMEILVLDAPHGAFGVDTADDLARAEDLIRRGVNDLT